MTEERDWGSGPGPSAEILAAKSRLPALRPGLVVRTALLDRLLDADSASLICIVAPPGYGKTTLLAQWAERMGSRVGWVSVDVDDNDPAALLTSLAIAVDRIEPIDPGVFRALAAPGGSITATVLPQFTAALSAMREPVALVLDQVELLGNTECLDAVAELAVKMPIGSRLALGTRSRPPLPLGLLRAQGRVVEIGAEELAMGHREAHALLEGAGVRLAEAEVAELARRTEGWPIGLHFAAQASKAGSPRDRDRPAFSGNDHLMAGYLRSELLARLPDRTVSFLTRTSVLERMSGPLCDAVLGAPGSGRMLEALESSNLLVVPLDRRRAWYRYHQLFRDLLRAELRRREPELVAELHTRASAWCEANGLPEVAIDHAQAAGDVGRVARLVAGLLFRTYAGGQAGAVGQWLAWFEDRGLIERYPPVAVLGAVVQALTGNPEGAERWADAAERGIAAARSVSVARMPADGSTTASYLAMLRGLLCRNGVDRMRADAEAALAGLSPGSPWRALALLLQATACLLDGQPGHADPILAHAVEIGTNTGALPAASAALAERSLAAIQRDDWGQAQIMANQALSMVRTGQLHDDVMSPLVHAVTARTALHHGDLPGAQQHVARAARLRPLLTAAVPWGSVQTLLELGRAYLALNDAAGAKAVLRQARDILRLRPDLGILREQAEELRSGLDMLRGGAIGPSSLTTAELRLLPLLSTYLTFPEIGQRLHLSPHTVKAQAISVYRKLGVSSRSEAVKRLREIGLLST